MNRCSRVCAVFVALALVLAASPVVAAPNSKIIQALNAAAQKDFDAGNFEKAAVAFLEIYQQDPSQPLALYNAARGFHLAGNLERAEECYRNYLALGKTPAEKLPKIEGYLRDLQQSRAAVKAVQAQAAERTAHFAVALELWLEAAHLAPDNPAYVAHAGRAAQLAQQRDKAIALYTQYLAKAPSDAPDFADVVRWRGELAQAQPETAQESTTKRPLAKAEDRPKPADTGGETARPVHAEKAEAKTEAKASARPVQKKPETDDEGDEFTRILNKRDASGAEGSPVTTPRIAEQRGHPEKLKPFVAHPVLLDNGQPASRLVLFWSSAIVGLAGGGLMYLTLNEKQNIISKLDASTASGNPVDGLTQAEYAADKTRLDRNYLVGSGMAMGGGAGALVSLLWMALGADAKAMVVPQPGGASVVMVW